jgi:hypothetical protein
MNRLWIVVVVIIVGLLVLGQCVPIIGSYTYFCPSCAAFRHDTKIFGLHYSTRISQPPMATYWKQSVDAHHAHKWIFTCSTEHYTVGKAFGDGQSSVFAHFLGQKSMVAVLSSLPTPVERKKFAARLWHDYDSHPEQHRVIDKMLNDISVAYDQNPKRTDWQEIMKKHGYAP